MRLQGDDGYYSREVEFQGDTFQIRELTEDEIEEWDEFSQQLTDLRRESRGIHLREEQGEELTEEDYDRLHEIGQETVRLQKAQTDMVVCAGLVDWPDDRPCTPENIAKLPPSYKTYLAIQIVKDSTLQYEDADFFGEPQTRSPKESR